MVFKLKSGSKFDTTKVSNALQLIGACTVEEAVSAINTAHSGESFHIKVRCPTKALGAALATLEANGFSYTDSPRDMLFQAAEVAVSEGLFEIASDIYLILAKIDKQLSKS